MRSVLRLLASGLILSFLLVGSVYSQSTQTGGITGVVTDQSGALVKGATVDIISETTGRSVRTLTVGEDGAYTANLLPPGGYRLEVTASNFKKAVVAGVKVNITETARQDVSLEAGKIQETVNVEASPSLINPSSAQTGQAIDSQTLNTLPLASPNFLFLLSLSSGVSGEPTDVRTAGRGTADVSVNGQRTSNNSVSLNGINVNDFNLAHFDTVPLPNPNTLQEMKVATSLYDATQGSKGGGALGLVTKTGTKDFHWDLYWQHRNDYLNANEYFFNKNGTKRGRLLQNVFGGSASGPVPAAGGFWFFNYQGVRARNGIDPLGSSTVPIVQSFNRSGDGSVTAQQLADQFNLSVAQIDPVAVKILNVGDTRFGGRFLVPRPGQGGCGAVGAAAGVGAQSFPGNFTCTFSAIAPIRDNQYTISYDRSFRKDKDKITGTWFWDEGSVAKPFGTDTTLTNPRNDFQWNRYLSITHTHLFSSTKVNELRAGYSRFLFGNVPTDTHAASEVGVTAAGQFPGLYRLAVTGLFSLGTGVNDDRGTISNTYNVVETFSLIAGKHSLRMGGEAVQYQLNRFNNFAVRGSLTTGSTTSGTSLTGNALAQLQYNTCRNDTNDCSAFQNFLRGRITAIQSAFGDPARNFVATDYAAFIQDDYRWKSNITFNVGLRWEAMSFGHDKLNRAGIYDPALAAAGRNPFLIPEAVNLAGFHGTPGVRDCALERCRDDNNFAPRVGFAWDINKDQKTVVRGGYGIYYQRLSNQNILQNSLAAPFTVQPLDNRANPSGLGLANPFAGQPAPSIVAQGFIPQATRFIGLFNTSTGAISNNPNDVNSNSWKPIFVNEQGQRCLGYASHIGSVDNATGATNCSINLASFTSAPLDAYTPYTQQWNLTIQRELKGGWALETGYVGSHFIGGIGIWDPYIAKLASPTAPITIRDANGVAYNITTNTVNNEELRHQILGLSRKKGSRYSGNIGFANYSSWQTTLSRRLHRGLYFQGAYTYSKTEDNVSGSLSTDELNATRAGQNGGAIYNDQSNPAQNKARGDFDRPHRLVVSYAYDIPMPKDSFFDNAAFKGWTVSGIVTYQKGLPFSVTDGNSGGLFGTAGGTAQFLCGRISDAYTRGTTSQRLDHYLRTECFGTAPTLPNSNGAGATGWGTAPRNAWRAPYQQNWDISLQKAFTLRESHSFQFRMDVFNLFNHPIFTTPSSVNIATTSTFTKITGTAVPARLIQFGLKYSH
ncbi:MAG TPA: carboxypeptidase-like regulatory domain-containing protein [Pyrinomonadaceae bacterium]|nr:carboxypeptidase-like regulatory domain-containing protein [Pyrinomonadaceae bacterium]